MTRLCQEVQTCKEHLTDNVVMRRSIRLCQNHSDALQDSGVRTSHSCFTRTVKVTICIILERLLDRLPQLPHVTTRTTVHRIPKLLKGQRRRTMEGQMGGSPKASATASGKGNQPAGGGGEEGGDSEINRSCSGPYDIQRDGHSWLENHETNRIGPRSSHNQGSVHARVTVVAAPNGNVRNDAVLASLVP